MAGFYTRVIFSGSFPACAWHSGPRLLSPLVPGCRARGNIQCQRPAMPSMWQTGTCVASRLYPRLWQVVSIAFSQPRPCLSLNKSQMPSSQGAAAPYMLLAPKAKHFLSAHASPSLRFSSHSPVCPYPSSLPGPDPSMTDGTGNLFWGFDFQISTASVILEITVREPQNIYSIFSQGFLFLPFFFSFFTFF